MNQQLQRGRLQELCDRTKLADRWCPEGPSQGSEAKKLLHEHKINGLYYPKKRVESHKERYHAYQQEKRNIRATHQLLQENLQKSFPEKIDARSQWKIEALCRLMIDHERAINPTVHLIFETATVTWNDLVEMYDCFKSSNLSESAFPLFLLNAYEVICGNHFSYTTMCVFPHPVNEKLLKGQRYVGPDFWEWIYQKTGIAWQRAFDPFPRGNVFKDAKSYVWPRGKVYFNPPFKLYKHFWDHVKPQLESGRITDLLLVMPWDKWHGRNNGEPLDWVVEELKSRDDYVVFDTRHRFILPDLTRFEDTFHLICVYIINK